MPTKKTKTNGTPRRTRKTELSHDELLAILREQRRRTEFTETEKAMIEAWRDVVAVLNRQEEKAQENAPTV